MDHRHYDWSPIPFRKPLSWPRQARVAVFVVVNIEHFEITPPEDAFFPADFPGGIHNRRPRPDYVNYSIREYGNRIGIFRIFDVLRRHGFKATMAVDGAIASRYPRLVGHCMRQGGEFVAHGRSVTRLITSKMSEAEERTYIRLAREEVEKGVGARPRGWLGPEYAESARTPDLLAAEGFEYVMDWPNDDQPYDMNVARGRLVSLPLALEMDDVYAHWNRRIPIWSWSQLVRDSFDRLYKEGAESGRVLGLSLHPWLIGQPFRIAFLDEILAHVSERKDVWSATAGEVVDAFANQNA